MSGAFGEVRIPHHRLLTDPEITSGLGSAAPLISISLVRTVSFTIFTTTDTFYGKLIRRAFGPNAVSPKGEPRSGSLPKPGDALRWALAGGTSGAVITVIACEFDGDRENGGD